MIYCGLVCEYNPFHTGHLYQLERIKQTGLADAVVCAMSGSFVQRAEPAIVDKYIRAGIALANGADVVLQIPTAFTVSGGERFALASVGLLAKIKGLKYLAFGCESQNFELIKLLSRIQADESAVMKAALRGFLASGVPYASAVAQSSAVAADALGYSQKECLDILNKPNNVLAIEYLKVIYRGGLDIEPIFVHRVNDYNSSDLGGQFASASGLRNAILAGKLHDAAKFLPFDTSLIADNMVDYKLFDELTLFAVRMAGVETLRALADCAEGIENRLFENMLRCTSVASALEKTKTKRYTYARLKRIVVQAMLGITAELVASPQAPCGKLIAIKPQLKKHLADFEGVVTTKKDTLKVTDERKKRLIDIDQKADDIFAQLTKTTAGTFFSNRI